MVVPVYRTLGIGEGTMEIYRSGNSYSTTQGLLIDFDWKKPSGKARDHRLRGSCGMQTSRSNGATASHDSG